MHISIFQEEETECIVEEVYGTMGYMAPELRVKGMVSFKADIYSFGLVIVELLTGMKGYINEDVRKLLNHIWIKVLPFIYLYSIDC